MNKLISKIVGVVLGLSLAVGTGVAIGAGSKESTSKAEASSTASFTLSSAEEVTVDGVTATFAKGGVGSAPTWYSTGLRLYANNTITISSSNSITGIAFDWEKQGNKAFASVSASEGSYTHPSKTGSGTWTGSSNSVVFTLGSSGQLQLNTFSVTYESGVIIPTLETPKLSFDSSKLEISWENVNGATSYEYKIDDGEYTTGTSPVDVSNESAGSHTFSVIAKASGYIDSEAGTCDFTIPSADGYRDAKMIGGTNGSGVTVNSKTAIKVGTSKAGGDMSITVPAGATAIRFYAAAWKGASVTLSATPADKIITTSFALTADDGISNSSPFTLSGSESDFLFENVFLNNIASETKIVLSGSARFVVWGAQYTTQSTSVISVTGVSVTPETAAIAYKGSTTLTATVTPSNATVQTVVWSSNNENVATVAADGTVTAVDAGTATITATTTDGNFTDSCLVTVSAPAYTEKDVAGAIQVINGLTDGTTTTDYYKVTGYVVDITYQYSSASGDMSFTLADAKGSSPVLTCYRVKCSAAVADTILKDAKISLVGQLQKFVNNSVVTPELVNSLPSQITIIEPGIPAQTYEVTIAEALGIISSLESGKSTYDKYTVTGVITAITHTYSSGKISFEIGVSQTATEVIEVYDLVLSLEDAGKVEVGATIKVTGNLKLFNAINELVNGESFELISAPAHEVKDVYDLDFVHAKETDGTAELTIGTWRTVIKGDSSEMSISKPAKIYGGSNNTLKFGSSDAKGTVTFGATGVSISRIIICAKTFISVNTETLVETPDASGIVVNSGTAQALDTNWTYYTFDLDTTASQITIAGSKTSKCRFYVKDIIFIDASAQDAIDAYGYAATFMNATREECAVTNVSSSTWTTASGAWTSLSSDGKDYFANKNANATGNLVEEMLARYEIIVKGYSYENFMTRNLNGSRSLNVINNNNALVIVVITAFVGVTFVGGYFFLRKKKEN